MHQALLISSFWHIGQVHSYGRYRRALHIRAIPTIHFDVVVVQYGDIKMIVERRVRCGGFDPVMCGKDSAAQIDSEAAGSIHPNA